MKLNLKDSNEIDLNQLFSTLWIGKWVIFAFIIFFILLMLLFLIIKQDSLNNFTSNTEIYPISSMQLNKYAQFNSSIQRMPSFSNTKVGLLNDFFITVPIIKSNLLTHYIEKINERKLVEKVIKEKKLLNDKNYNSEKEYEKAVERLAATLQLLPPDNVDGKFESSPIKARWSISFDYDDRLKWLEALDLLNKLANEEIKKDIQNSFQSFIKNERANKNYALEDINNNILNTLFDFNLITQNRLEYLSEQAKIARALNIPKNALSATSFQSGDISITQLEGTQEFYLRGYETIEEEIKLINSREKPEAFIDNLLALKQEKRRIEEYKNLERAEEMFTNTPIYKGDNFIAANLFVSTTKFTNKYNPILLIVLASLLGAFFGVTYILVKKNLLLYKK